MKNGLVALIRKPFPRLNNLRVRLVLGTCSYMHSDDQTPGGNNKFAGYDVYYNHAVFVLTAV